MAIDALNSVMPSSAPGSLRRSALSQDDFIKLFLTELSYQDPMEPVKSREFLAQMAQFSNLEQTRVSNENTAGLLSLGVTTQSLGLLGKQVQLKSAAGSGISGKVTAVAFTQDGPSLTVTETSGVVHEHVTLNQINLVRS